MLAVALSVMSAAKQSSIVPSKTASVTVARVIAPVYITLSLPCGEQNRQKRLDPKANWERFRFAIACKVHAILALSLNPLRKGDRAHYGEEETHKEEQE